MKLLVRLTFLGAVALTQSAWADTGPYYVYSSGFCNIKKVYLNSVGDIYGTEVGCSDSLGAPIVGAFSSDGVAFASTVKSSGSPCVRSYSPNGNLVVGCSAGTSIVYTANSKYTVQEAKPQTPVTYHYTVSTEMPDVALTKDLPSMDN